MRYYNRCWKCPPLPQSLQRTMDTQFVFKADHIRNRIRQMLIISKQCTSVFSTPHSTVLTINVSKWNHASSVKANCPTQKPLLVQKMTFSIIQLLWNWQQTKLKQGSVLVLNDSENVCSVHCSGRADSYMLVSAFIDLWVVLYGTPYIRNIILGNNLHIL